MTHDMDENALFSIIVNIWTWYVEHELHSYIPMEIFFVNKTKYTDSYMNSKLMAEIP